MSFSKSIIGLWYKPESRAGLNSESDWTSDMFAGQEASNLNPQQYDVTVRDLHSAPEPFTLQHNGFQLERLEVPSDVDWENEEQVRRLPDEERVYACTGPTLTA